ncbi:MAG: hypothetical protein WBG92_12960 [Thiohalocapsa sp.]
MSEFLLDDSVGDTLPQSYRLQILVPWSRLLHLLRAALSKLAERKHVDVPHHAAAHVCLRPLCRLPRLKAARWALAGQVIIFLSPRLYPSWSNFEAIKALVPRLRRSTGLEILGMQQGPEGAARVWDGEDWGALDATPPIACDCGDPQRHENAGDIGEDSVPLGPRC